MDSGPLSAIIGLIGVVAGALITTFSDELKSLVLRSSKTNKAIVGEWKCLWHVDERAGKRQPVPDTISDAVSVSKIVGEKIVAIAYNAEYGNYKITGRVSRSNLVTLHYEGEGARQPIGGVIILDLKAVPTEMNGYWYEFTTDRKFLGGRTTWTKV